MTAPLIDDLFGLEANRLVPILEAATGARLVGLSRREMGDRGGTLLCDFAARRPAGGPRR